METKTCPGGEKCHWWNGTYWMAWSESCDAWISIAQPHESTYCFAHNCRLDPGGECVPMVPLERAVEVGMMSFTSDDICDLVDCLHVPCASEKCLQLIREALRAHLREEANDRG